MLFLRFVTLALFSILLTGCGNASEPVSAPTPTEASVDPTGSESESAASASESGSGSWSGSGSAAPSPGRVVLTGDGLEVDERPLLFGTTYDEAIQPLTTALGAPTLDTDETSPASAYGICPGTVLRALEYADGAAVLLFGDVDGPGRRFYAWNVREQGLPEEAPRVRALVGDAATLELGVGTTVAELQAGAAEGTLTVFAGEEVFGPGFRLEDQSGGLFGTLTESSAAGRVTFVSGGSGCGE